MARKPQSPPSWRDRLPAIASDYLGGQDEALLEAVRAAGRAGRYLHWEDLRHRPAPEGRTAEDVWSLVKFERSSRRRNLPLLLQKDGSPFWIAQTDPLRAALHRVDTREPIKARLKETSSSEGDDIDEIGYRLMVLVEEAHHSSAIEGAVTTRRQSADLIRSGRAPKDSYERMVLNNFEAIERLSEWVDSPLTPELLCEIQATVTDGTLDRPEDAGRFRQDDEVRIVDVSPEEVVFEPPTFQELDARMERLCEFANEEARDENFVHPVTRAILLHHQLAYDHPFADGNGRTGRALFLWSALRSGYSWFRSLSISRAIHRAKEQYYRSFLHVQTDEGDATYFVHVQLRFIEREINELASYLGRLAEVRRWARAWDDASANLNRRQLDLLERTLDQPDVEFTVKEHQLEHGVTQPTAHGDLERMTGAGLFVFRTAGRGGKKFYRPSKKLVAMIEKRARASN